MAAKKFGYCFYPTPEKIFFNREILTETQEILDNLKNRFFVRFFGSKIIFVICVRNS